MFHGTSSVFNDGILKKGLLVNPPKKTWSEGFYKSLDGVYFSCSLDRALFFADKSVKVNGGNSVIIIADINKIDAIPDEDNIARLIQWSADISSLDYELFENTFFRLLKEIDGISIDLNLEYKIKQFLIDVLNLEIKRREGSSEIVKYYDLISKILKSKVFESQIYNNSFRIIEDVKICNKINRIVSIFEFLPNENIKTIYESGCTPTTFFFQLRKKYPNFKLV